MENLLIGAIVGVSLSVVLFWIWRYKRPGKEKSPPKPQIYASIEDLRSVGELVVFKIVTKEIVTAADHWFGQWGKKYFKWLASTKKMAMIFEFEINFRYNLQSPDFIIQPEADRNYKLRMPKCLYDIYIRDISFYDEQSAKLLPWLLPGLINQVFGTGFDENDRNRLKKEAREQAELMAKTFVQKMRSEVQNSAIQTLETLARGFGAEKVTIDFTESEFIAVRVESRPASNN